nr:carboxylesterase family protein [Culicoidibacter larvae]
MKRFFLVFVAGIMAVSILSGCSMFSTFDQNVEQQVTGGKVSGAVTADEAALSWLGVPYAAAPVNELRWHAPADVVAWNDVRDATSYGNVCTQVSGGKVVGDEDCLYLNVWRPNTNEANLPVMVYVHGGGNRNDSGNNYVGDKLAAQANAIVITINYRLDVLGYLTTPALRTGNAVEDSGNFALLDIQKALQWVQGNAAAFGGDAKNVTLAGQSAGARDVMATLISPEFKGLYQKAILMSGGETLSTVEDGEATADTVISNLLVSSGTVADATAAENWLKSASDADVSKFLYDQPAESLVMALPSAIIRMQTFTHLFMDGTVIPKEGFDVIASGNYFKVPVMLGSNYDEFGAFNLLDPAFFPKLPTGELDQPENFDTFTKSKEYGSQLYASFCVETFADRLYAAGMTDIYAYRMQWGHDLDVANEAIVKYIGATHGADVDFVFGYEMNPANKMFPGAPLYTDENAPGRELLTTAVMNYYGNFLHNGDPKVSDTVTWSKWTPTTEQEKIMIFNASDTELKNEMSDMYWNRDEVMKELKENTTEDQQKVIDGVYKGRFFMIGVED